MLMVAPLKLSIGVNIDAAGAKSGGVQAQQAVAAIGTEAQRTQTKLQALINSSVGLNSGAANQSAREWVGALAMQGKSLDDLRAKYNPLFSVIRAYKAEITAIKTAHAQGALTSAEMTAAITRERQVTLASIDAIKGRGAALRQAAANANSVTAAAPVGRGANAGAFQTSNIAAQFQDIGVTAAMGMSPVQIALQQGTQMAAVLGSMERPAAGLFAAFTSILSPVSLATIAVTGLAAAGIQYFTSVPEEANKASKALEDHEDYIRRLRAAYGDAVLGAREYSAERGKLIEQENKDRIALYKSVLLTSADDARSPFLDVPASEYRGLTKIIGDVQSATALLDASTKAGKPDLKSYIEAVIEIENHPATPESIREIARGVRESAKEGLDAQAKLEPLIGVFNGLGQAASQQEARVKSFSDAMRNLRSIGVPALTDLEALTRDFNKALDGPAGSTEAGVRELTRQYEAARRRLSNIDPTVTNSDGLITDVPVPRRKPTQIDLGSEGVQAQQQRRRALEDTLAAQRLELSLIGKTVAEQERLRMEYRLTAELKAEAARNGTAIDQAELEMIRQKAAEYGRVAQRMAAINALREQDQTILRLQTEISLV
ncbi:MAG: phage tail length tape measure family protein, partial [Rhizobium sp.]|nr:phage tail length tape measure family protein [Rhizobium sp.]